MSWELACWNGTATYTIDRIESVTTGFGAVSSKLPVVVGSSNTSHISMTLSAPPYPFYGTVEIWVRAHAN